MLALARKPAAGEVDICVRTSPEHQLRLVEAWQPLHGVVAMTGAGVAYFRVADSLGQTG
ncbi:hypothetical protein [Marinobacter changyiensis]|uniref:hypothetical protein n=1 Tax=Marinobacter changyiensis TaxID=2604091 RepID=UPI001FE6773A|nr:hypothetical protein [Marinobacter changyiensis]